MFPSIAGNATISKKVGRPKNASRTLPPLVNSQISLISTANNEEAAAAEDTATVPTNHPPFAISSNNNNALENKGFLS